MLGIAVLGGGRAGYYLDDLGDELARIGPAHGIAATWVGRGAEGLGLAGGVWPERFSALLEGRHPETDRRLLHRAIAVGAFDLTFSAPKPVSLLFALGADGTSGDVLAAHRSAVRAAVNYLDRRALSVRRRVAEERTVLPTDGMVGAAFDHCLSRAGDPHLHTHVVAANLTHGVDGRWSALDSRALYAHRTAAGALYEAHLRGELTTRLDLRWQARGRGYEPEGIDPLLSASFSGRAAEIREAATRAGARSARGRRIAWAATRGPKDRRSGEVLHREWSRRAAGMSPPVIVGPGRTDPDRALDEYRFAAHLAHLPGGVTRRDVVAAWAVSTGPGGDGRDIDAAVEHWVPAEGAVGVAEPHRAPARCVPAPHLLHALGPRPVGSAGQPVWRGAAIAIDRYRSRWGAGDGRTPMEEDRRAMSSRQLAEHIELSHTLREALSLLGPGRTAWGREGPARGRS